MRWLRLEARGVLWHITDRGEPYRTMWLRRNGEYLYDPAATRDKRANEELTTLRERRIRLGKLSAIAGSGGALLDRSTAVRRSCREQREEVCGVIRSA